MQEFGPVFAYTDHSIAVLDPELTHDVLRRTGDEFTAESPTYRQSVDPEALRTYAQKFVDLRRVGASALSRRQADGHATTSTEIFHTVIAETEGESVDIQSLFERFASRAIADYFLGADAGPVIRVLPEAVGAARNFSEGRRIKPPWLPIPRSVRLRRANRDLRGATVAAIERRMAECRTEPQDVLDVFCEAMRTSETGFGINDVARYIEAALRASYGVTATTLSWLTWMRSGCPGMASMRQSTSPSLFLVAHGQGPRYADENFVEELFRYFAPVWMVTRFVRRDTTLGGFNVKSGQVLYMSPYVMHHDPRNWGTDPGDFEPARWTAETPHSRFSYIPFSSGPRMCVGPNLGNVHTLAAVRAFAEYDVEDALCAGERFLTLHMPADLRARIVRK